MKQDGSCGEGEFVKMGAYSFGGEDKSGVVELGEHVLQKFGTEFALLSAHLLGMEGQGVVVARAALLIALQHVVSKQLHLLLLLQSRSIMNLFALIFFSCSFLLSKVKFVIGTSVGSVPSSIVQVRGPLCLVSSSNQNIELHYLH
jgi:hypothetical protein